MNKHEQRIIELIEKNPFLSDKLKKRYILALFLMSGDAQEKYLELWQVFDAKCADIKEKPLLLEHDDIETIFRTVDEVKKDLIKKIKTSDKQKQTP